MSGNKLTNYLFLDLELNQPSNTIIQIGYVIANIYEDIILERKCLNINSNETLNPYIIDLTGIKQEDVDKGMTLLEAFEILKTDHKKHNVFCNPVTWGGGDSVELMKQLTTAGYTGEGIFGRRWIDVKTIWHFKRINEQVPLQGGLARSMTKVGLKFEGRKHNAMDDSLNTYKMFQALRKELK